MAERKRLRVELKADKEGSFRAIFATFGVVDHDGDVTLPGAFKAGAPVRVAQFGHNWGDYVIGDGTLGSDQKDAWADAEFYLDTSRGLDTYRSVKRASSKNLQEWSYGFDVLKASTDKADLEKYPGAERVLMEMQVHEISPVMLGAGIDTRTDFIKSAPQVLTGRTLRKARALVARLKAAPALDANTLATVAQIDLLADSLDELVDTLMDQLNIPDPDEIEEGEPEEPKGFTFVGHGEHVLADVQLYRSRAKTLVSMRSKEGRVLSEANLARIGTVRDGLRAHATELDDLISTATPKNDQAALQQIRLQFLRDAARRGVTA